MSTTVYVICSFCEKEVKQEEIDIHRLNCDRGIGSHEEECSAKVDENEKKSSFPKETSHGVDNDHPCPSCVQTVGKSHIEKEASVVHCDNFSKEVEESRKDLSELIESECIETVIECKYCKKEFKKKLLVDHHTECLKFSIPCPESCDVEVAREDVERHLDEECQKLFSACPYKKIQCSYESFPAGMRQHMREEVEHHLLLTKDAFDKLHIVVESIQEKLESERIRNEELQREIKELRLVSFLWKVEHIAEEIDKAKNDKSHRIGSPLFFSSKHGYKLRVILCPDSVCDFKGYLGVGVIFHVMHGECDSIMKWPFTKLVKLRLVNQEMDDEDIVDSFDGPESYIKPKDGNCNFRLGSPKFVSHEVLNSRSYIVDNAIFLEVTVE